MIKRINLIIATVYSIALALTVWLTGIILTMIDNQLK